jgi:hypothetical protein
MTTAQLTELVHSAEVLGKVHGISAAGWYFDGNTDPDVYEWVWQGLEDGDPEVLDTLPGGPLSGEWAGGMTPAGLLAEVEAPEGLEDWQEDEICSAYEQAFETAAADTIANACRSYLRGAELLRDSFDMDAFYTEADDSLAVAWTVRRITADAKVVAVMVGDDTEYHFDSDQLRKISEDEFCYGCGQIGCGH